MDFNGAYEFLQARGGALEGRPVSEALALYWELCRHDFTDGDWVLLVEMHEDQEDRETRIGLQMQLFDGDDLEDLGIQAAVTGDLPTDRLPITVYGALRDEEPTAQNAHPWPEFVERVEGALEPFMRSDVTLRNVAAPY